MKDFISLMLLFLKKIRQLLNNIGGAKLLTTFTCIIFIGFSIYTNYSKLLEQRIDGLTILFLLLGLLISWLSLVINAFAWKSIIGWLGHNNSNIDLISLFLSSNLLKYIPGGIWHFVERIRSLSKFMTLDKAFLSVLIEPFFMITAAFTFVAFGDFHIGFRLLCFTPYLLFIRRFREPLLIQINRIKETFLKKTSSEKMSKYNFNLSSNTLSPEYPALPLAIEILFIALRFCGFFICLKAFSLENSFDIFHWCAIFSLAWAVGLIIPSAPGGVGVFEAFILLITGSSVSETLLLSSLLCYRLIVSAADLLAAIVLPRRIYYE